MYGLVVRVKIDPDRGDEAAQMLKAQVVPKSRERAGFTGGYWLRSDDGTRGMSSCTRARPRPGRSPTAPRKRHRARR